MMGMETRARRLELDRRECEVTVPPYSIRWQWGSVSKGAIQMS